MVIAWYKIDIIMVFILRVNFENAKSIMYLSLFTSPVCSSTLQMHINAVLEQNAIARGRYICIKFLQQNYFALFYPFFKNFI